MCLSDLEKLLLTPLIFSKKLPLHEIRERSLVQNLPGTTTCVHPKRISYSGFFTVDDVHSSNIFFWYFPQPNVTDSCLQDETLILWLNGGPGSASMKGLFAEHGPFYIDESNELQIREFALTNKFSVIYVDSPVGAGFSYTETEEGWSRTLEDVNKNLLSMLDQFFTLFPETQCQNFYISGESFGGKFVPSLSLAIHHRNEQITLNKMAEKDDLIVDNYCCAKKINLKGFTIGAPFTDPINQTEYAEFLYGLSLIDGLQRDTMLNEEKLIHGAILENRSVDALKLTSNLVLNIPDCLFTKFTGSTNNFNFLETSPSPQLKQYVSYIDQNEVRRAIHVGHQNFYDYNPRIARDLVQVFFKSEKQTLENLLELKYKILIYSSQLDILVPPPSLRRLVEGLEWTKNYLTKQKGSAERQIWKMNQNVVGYVKIFGQNFYFIELTNVGHLAFMDNPETCVQMMSRFVEDWRHF